MAARKGIEKYKKVSGQENKKVTTKKVTKSNSSSKTKLASKSKAKNGRSTKVGPKKAKTKKITQSDKEETLDTNDNTSEIKRTPPKRVQVAMESSQEARARINEETQRQFIAQVKVASESKRSNPLVKDDVNPNTCDRDTLVVEYAALIKYIAQKIAARLPANIELDDLISSGVIGLMDAIDKYDSSRDNKFKTYAEFRIRGAILDELRSQDWVPRSVREKAKQLERVFSRIEVEKGRQATDDEMCEQLGISQEEYYELLNEVRSVSLLSYDDYNNFSKADKRSFHGVNDSSGKVPTPFSEVTSAHMRSAIAEAIKDLPEKQRLVLSLYYYEDLNLKEIGRVLDVTESRVSQLHTQAVMKLKARLKIVVDEVAVG